MNLKIQSGCHPLCTVWCNNNKTNNKRNITLYILSFEFRTFCTSLSSLWNQINPDGKYHSWNIYQIKTSRKWIVMFTKTERLFCTTLQLFFASTCTAWDFQSFTLFWHDPEIATCGFGFKGVLTCVHLSIPKMRTRINITHGCLLSKLLEISSSQWKREMEPKVNWNLICCTHHNRGTL